MADRTFNAIDVDLWDKDWGELAIVAASMLIGTCPNKQGIFDFPGGRIRRFLKGLGASDDETSAAFLKLVEVGLIKFYREGKVVWLVKKFKRELWNIRNDDHRKGVRRFIANFPEIEPEFRALYGETYEQGRIVLELTPEVHRSTTEPTPTDTDTESDIKNTLSKKREPPNKLRAPTERERSLFPLVEKLSKYINDARDDLGLAPLTQNEAKAAITLRQCEEIHNLTAKELGALADWMFHAKNKDRLFNVQNLSLIHNWRKPWTNGTAIIVKWEEFLLWLQKSQNTVAG